MKKKRKTFTDSKTEKDEFDDSSPEICVNSFGSHLLNETLEKQSKAKTLREKEFEAQEFFQQKKLKKDNERLKLLQQLIETSNTVHKSLESLLIFCVCILFSNMLRLAADIFLTNRLAYTLLAFGKVFERCLIYALQKS